VNSEINRKEESDNPNCLLLSFAVKQVCFLSQNH